MVSKKLVAQKSFFFLFFFLIIHASGITQNVKWVMQFESGVSYLKKKNTGSRANRTHDEKMGISFNIGGSFHYKLGPSVVIELGLKHTEIRASEFISIKTSNLNSSRTSSYKYHAKYYSIPFKVKSTHGRISYNFGLRYMRLIKVRIHQDYKDFNSPGNSRILNFDDLSIRKYDFGPELGFSYHFNYFAINFDFFMGTKKTRSNTTHRFHRGSFSNRQLTLGIGYYL